MARIGSTKITLRPIKLAFVVNPHDKESFLEAVKINTFLWGGAFNPIIPFFKKKPKVISGDFELKRASAKAILDGYLDNFDPDFVVPMGKVEGLNLDFGDREVLRPQEILAGIKEEGTPRFGIGLFEILQHYGYEELRFVRKKPLDIILPAIGAKHKAFLASVFGLLPEEVERALGGKGWMDALGARKVECALSNYIGLLQREKIFPRRMSGFYLEPIPRHSWHHGDCLYFMDAANLLDIIDYWNLRAIGWKIIPIPKQICGSKKILDFSRKFINSNFGPLKHNPSLYYTTTILKSRSVSDKEVHEFVKALDIKSHKQADGNRNKYVLQMWQPRVWKRWAWDKDGVECCSLEADSRDEDAPSGNRVQTKTLDPEFLGKYSSTGEPKFANEIEIRLYGEKEMFAEVLPQGGKNLVRAVDSGFREIRFSRKGIVFLSHYRNWQISFKLPEAEDIFKEWLAEKGWEIELSSSGKIAKQIISHLKGVNGVSVLTYKGVVELLARMAGDNRVMADLRDRMQRIEKLLLSKQNAQLAKSLEKLSKVLEEKTEDLESSQKSLEYETLIHEAGKIASKQKRWFKISAEGILWRLIESGIFDFGVKLQCTECGQKSWYLLSQLDRQLRCARCLKTFKLPIGSPKDIKWSYQISGPFRQSGLAQGSYSVVLALHFFSNLWHASLTPILSFIRKNDGVLKSKEVDLAVMFKKARFAEDSEFVLLFTECKSFNDPFKKSDIEKMVLLGQEFSGSVLVFATLKESLTDKEKSLILPLVEKYRKNWKNGKPRNQILILTGTELFSDDRFADSWEQAGGKHKQFAKSVMWADLDTLCDYTQQLYLGAKPFWDWYKENENK